MIVIDNNINNSRDIPDDIVDQPSREELLGITTW